jgi:hypothetical protein
MSQLEVDKVIPQSGTTLTLGESGDTVSIPSGATFTPTLTAPIIDEINDNNGNEEIVFTTTASAVNELTIANAATGNAPEIAATGDDTDIDLKLTPKGAGNLVLDGIEFPNADGSANQVLQTNGSGVLSFATPSGGKVLQVVTATDSTSRTISSPSTFTLGGSTLTLSITPSSASNKIFINFTSCCSPTTGVDAQLTIFRDSTNIGNTSGFTKFTDDGGYVQQPVAISVLDSPSTTSAITYEVRCTGNSLTLNANNTKGTITAFEIQG